MKYEVIEISTGRNAKEVFTNTPFAVTPDGGLVWWDESGGWEMDKEPLRWEIRPITHILHIANPDWVARVEVQSVADANAINDAALAEIRRMASAGKPLIDVDAHR